MAKDPVKFDTRTDFRTDIEGVRALAIILVVLYHAGLPSFAGGYVGVDVFFVLSGYLITSLLYIEQTKTGTIKLLEFYSRRARRLLPALGVVLAFSVIVGYFVYSPIEQARFATTAFATAVYASNIFFAKARTDYLGPKTDADPLLHTWSLSVEEQFYIIYPLFLLVIIFFASRLKKPRPSQTITILIASLAVVFLLSLAVSIVLTEVRQPWAFFMMPSRAWEFALGGLGYLVPIGISHRLDLRHRYRSAQVVLGWIAFLGLIATGAVFNKNTQFPGINAMIPAGLAVLLLCTSTVENAFSVRRILDLRPMQVIGRLSYSWYLWHWIILVFCNAVFKFQYPVLANLVLILIALAISELSYRFVENPIRHNKLLGRRPVNSLVMAGSLTLVCIVLTAGWAVVATNEMSSPEQIRFAKASDDVPVLYELGCHADFNATESKGCVFGNKDSETKVVLFGDSHAAQWFPALAAIANRNGWSLRVFTKSACPPVDKLYFNQSIGRPYDECKAWQDNVIQELTVIRPQLIISSAYTGYDYSLSDWEEGTEKTLGRLIELGSRVVTIRDTPSPGFNVPVCLSRQDWYREHVYFPLSCQTDKGNALDDKVFEIQKMIVGKLTGAFVLDMNTLICPEKICRTEVEKAVVYRDDHHLTASFSASLSHELESRLPEFVGLKKNGNRLVGQTAQ